MFTGDGDGDDSLQRILVSRSLLQMDFSQLLSLLGVEGLNLLCLSLRCGWDHNNDYVLQQNLLVFFFHAVTLFE